MTAWLYWGKLWDVTCNCLIDCVSWPRVLLWFCPDRTSKRKKIPSCYTPRLLFFFQMLSIRVVILFVLLVLTKAENKNGSYIRGEKVNPAYRIVNGNNPVDPKNEILEFQSVKRLSGSKPAQEGAGFRRTAWFWGPYKNNCQLLGTGTTPHHIGSIMKISPRQRFWRLDMPTFYASLLTTCKPCWFLYSLVTLL